MVVMITAGEKIAGSSERFVNFGIELRCLVMWLELESGLIEHTEAHANTA
jgi:hypothetical protein